MCIPGIHQVPLADRKVWERKMSLNEQKDPPKGAAPVIVPVRLIERSVAFLKSRLSPKLMSFLWKVSLVLLLTIILFLVFWLGTKLSDNPNTGDSLSNLKMA